MADYAREGLAYTKSHVRETATFAIAQLSLSLTLAWFGATIVHGSQRTISPDSGWRILIRDQTKNLNRNRHEDPLIPIAWIVTQTGEEIIGPAAGHEAGTDTAVADRELILQGPILLKSGKETEFRLAPPLAYSFWIFGERIASVSVGYITADTWKQLADNLPLPFESLFPRHEDDPTPRRSA